MKNTQFIEMVYRCFGQTDQNTAFLPSEEVGIPVLERPLIGFAAADDPLFSTYTEPHVIGDDFRMPEHFLTGAKTVAVFFFPFTQEMRSRHAASTEPVSEAWNIAYGKHTKIEDDIIDRLKSELEGLGIRSAVPTSDKSFSSHAIPVKSGEEDDLHFSVTWSNRHAAFAAGLGTFGIHRHLISEKGCCGGLISLILDCELEPTVRKYTETYEYCSGCGSCVSRCPAGAITLDNLRNLKKCSEYAGSVRAEYGGFCGKCMVGIPCETRIPEKKHD